MTLLFEDDTTYQMSGTDINFLFRKANAELEKASVWFKTNKLTLIVKKTKFMLFSDKTLQLQGLNLKLETKILSKLVLIVKKNI